MHPDLKEVIDTARETRDELRKKKIDVKHSNAVFNQNHSIITAYALDLRERVFMAESADTVARLEGDKKPEQVAAE